MKKLFSPLFLFVQFALFAQDTQSVNKLNNNEIISFSSESQTTLINNIDVVFNSTQERSGNNRQGNSRKNSFESSYMAELNEDGELVLNNNLLLDPNLKKYDGMLTFSKDGKTVFFSVNRKIKDRKGKEDKEVKTKSTVNLQLFKANVDENGEWVNLEMLPFNSNHFSTGQPVLNEDDTKLYFVSDGPESLGRTDIFVVDLNEDGTYGKPSNLGPKVNTVERDIFPFIDKDNVLFFASDAHNKQGNLDVFVCKIFDNTISTPMKLKVPLNMGKEATASTTYNDDNSEYFTSNKQVGKGSDDIYAFAASIPIIVACEQEVSGIVRDYDTEELLPGMELILFDEDEKRLASFRSNKKDATFSFKQSCNSTYTLKGYLDGNLIGKQAIKTVNDLNAEPMKIVVNLDLSIKPEDKFISVVAEENKSVNEQESVSNLDASSFENLNDDTEKHTYYDFKYGIAVYTVQVGAYRENVQAHSYAHLTNVFNHTYDDGYNRYFSGVFESSSEARKYLELIKAKGHTDAFIVGLNGENRF